MKFAKSREDSEEVGFTLVEVTIAMSIASLVIGGMILGYLQMLNRAEWSAYSLAAHSLALQGLEQTRAAKWDNLASPAVDQLVQVNFPPTIEVLDVPIHSQNAIFATNRTTITEVRSTPPLRAIQVDCVWASKSGRVHTNSIVTYRAPDQ